MPDTGSIQALHLISREAALATTRSELRYRSEYCPCTGVTEDFVELQVQETT
jgi:hypothetical protein